MIQWLVLLAFGLTATALTIGGLGCAGPGGASFQTPSQPPRVLVIAHRGASGYLPEHTLEAYRLAIAQGADFIEPDLVISSDGVLVARHENELSESTDVADRPEFAGRRAVRIIDGERVEGFFTEDFTLAELKTLRARQRLSSRDPSHNGRYLIATFDEVVALAQAESKRVGRPIGVYPELKHPTYFRSIGKPLEEPFVAAVKSAGLDRRDAPIFVQCFEAQTLRRLRPVLSVRMVQLIDDTPDGRSMTTDQGLARISEYADGIGPNKRLIVPEAQGGSLASPTDLIARAHAVGLLVHPWTFRSDDPFLHPAYGGDAAAEYRQFIDLGADGVFSDFPDHAEAAR